MAKKLAIDWDESELRLVAAQCSGRSVKVTDAIVIPIGGGDVLETLRSAVTSRGLENTETLVAIGRGKAELRELQLPPVPDEELPDMVRFQAIRSFATAGDSAIVDYLVTNRTESGVEMIAAAVGPAKLTEIRRTCEAAGLSIKRISLRPLAAAALYLIHQPSRGTRDTVLIDLLADDAEIVVAREGRVIFVRTVRMPSSDATRGRVLAGELRRSLVACGSSGSLDRVVLWGRESVHRDDMKMLAEASATQVEVMDPFSLVEVDRKLQADLPDHVGRLAPLVGLLAADENDAARLVDFLNPRQRVEETPSPYRTALLIGVPIAVAALIGYSVYSQFQGLDRQIAELKSANARMKPDVDRALESIARTEKVDEFLDGDVNWLHEIRRLAVTMPPSDQLMVRSVSGTSDPRHGGGTLKVEGAVTKPSVIDDFESALRDESHRVVGEGASEEKTEDAYRWGFAETITVTGESVRNNRYAAMTAPPSADPLQPVASQPVASQPVASQPVASQPVASQPAQASPDPLPPAQSPVDSSPPAQRPVATVDQPAENPPGEPASEASTVEEPQPVEPAELAEQTPSEVQP